MVERWRRGEDDGSRSFGGSWQAALIILAALGGGAATGLLVMRLSHLDATLLHATVVVLIWSFVGCGAVIAQQSDSRVGLLLIGVGLAWLARAVTLLPDPPDRAYVMVVVALPAVLLVHTLVLLARADRGDPPVRVLLLLTWTLPLTVIPDYARGDRSPWEPCLACVSLDWRSAFLPAGALAHLQVAAIAVLLVFVLIRAGRGTGRARTEGRDAVRKEGWRENWPVTALGVLIALSLAAEAVGALLLSPVEAADARVPLNAVGVAVQAMLPPTLLVTTVRGWLRSLAADRRSIDDRLDRRSAEQLRKVQRDLHDGAQLRLLKAGFALKMARNQAAVESRPQLGEAIDAAADELALAIGELRRLAAGAAFPVDGPADAAQALRSLVAASPVPVELVAEEAGELPNEVAETVYFVAAESLTNIARHAGADSARIALRIEGEGAAREVRLEIADAGRGGAEPGAGSGLRGLADRVRRQGGDFVLSSPPGGGTRVKVVIPCASSSLMTPP